MRLAKLLKAGINNKFLTTISLCDHIFQISHVYDLFEKISKDYQLNIQDRNNIKIDFQINSNQDSINLERQFQISRNVMDAEQVSDAEIENIYIYRQICEFLIPRDFNAFHGSAITHKDKCIIFAGESGCGKSSQSALWKEHVTNVEYINDDKPIIGVDFSTDEVLAYGNPWSGKTNLNKNIVCPICAIVFISHTDNNQIGICKVKDKLKFSRLLNQWNLSTDKDNAKHSLEMLNIISENIPIFSAKLSLNKESVDLVYNQLFNS